MIKDPKMTFIIWLWLALSKVFAPLIHIGAKRDHLKRGMTPDRFVERLGVATVPRPDGRWIWVHAASLGEVSQTTQLVTELRVKHGFNVIVTTVTESGANWVAQSLPGATHQYLPLDTPKAVRRFLDTWSPEMAVFIEADIWPRLVLETATRKIPLTLINARPSKSRDRAPKSYRFLLANFFAITCKSTQVMDGLRTLGIVSDRLFSFGDLRTAAPALDVDPVALAALQKASLNRPVWVAASSHADDEAEIITACASVLVGHPNALLIWAPRHPERARNIMDAASHFVVHQRSKSQEITDQTQIYLADTLGELGTLFAGRRIVFLGGSFGSEGGHNPYEPACFGCHVLTGPRVRNHQDAFDALIGAGAATVVSDGADLGDQVVRIMASGGTSLSVQNGPALVKADNEPSAKTAALLVAKMPI